jgi:hypothetical protein
MRGHGVLAEPFAQVTRDAFCHPPRVDEDERGAVLADELGQPVEILFPDLVRHHRVERRARYLHAEIHAAPVAFVDDGALVLRITDCGLRIDRGLWIADRGLRTADEEARDLFDRLLRRRQADPQQWLPGDLLQALER